MSYEVMAQAKYPYLDLTVMQEVRDHVVSPCAAVLYTPDLRHVLWANGEGAQLIGASTVRQALEGRHTPNTAMMRQISVAAQKLDTISETRANLRLKRGFQTRLLGFVMRNVTLPDGEIASLLVSDSLHGRTHPQTSMAQTAVNGLDGYSHASAILDADGAIVAASLNFGELNLTGHDLAGLVNEVADERDRLVKRHIVTSKGEMPAGIARLADNPAMHLLVVAGDEEPHAKPVHVPAASARMEQPVQGIGAPVRAEPEKPQPVTGRISSRRGASGSKRLNRWYYKTEEPEPAEFLPYEEVEPVEDNSPLRENVAEIRHNEGLNEALQHASPSTNFEPEDVTHIASDDAAITSASAEDGDFRFHASAKPVRFVWETDAANTFVSASDELVAAVGPKSAAIEGLAWEEVGATRGLVNAAEISELLEKGDTWSGKTVLWPVQDTDLRVPIDLAGLPSFDRNRSFEGFSGFGIIRTADAMIDPDGGGFEFSGSANDEPPQPDDDFGHEAELDLGRANSKPEDTKIVDIETRRAVRIDRELSSGEQNAFDEIAQKLADTRTERPDTSDPKSTPHNDPAIKPFTPSAFAKRVIDEHDAGPDNGPVDSDSQVDTSILARLPIPVLVYRSNDMLFGNDEFFDLTGYVDLADLAAHGGVNALFGLRDREGNDDEAVIYHRDGTQLDVRAHLQRVPWDQHRAMLLTLRRNGGGPGDRKPEPAKNEDQSSGPDDASPDSTTRDNREDLRPSVRDAEEVSSEAELNVAETPLINHPERPVELPSVPPIAEVWMDQPEQTSSKAFGGLSGDDMRGIVDVATDGIIILSNDGIVRALNRSAEALFDVKPQKIEGHSITELLAPESHRIALDYLAGLTGTGVASLLNDGREIIGQTGKGGLIPLFMTIGKLENSDACCAVVRDITHYKKAEEDLVTAKAQAESANALKSDFLAKISHEIRTPLNAIIGFSDLMIEERFGRIDNDRYRGYLRDIRRSGNHVLDLVNDLLDISKIESGKVDLEFDACELNGIVSEAVAMIQPAANKERVIIRTSLSAVVPKVVADPRSIRQIVLNIVSNAIKYTRQGGQVIVSTVYDENGEVALRVRDTGIGMSELDLARAMKPFQQVGTITEAHKQGTGLGLPLTKALVEANRARFHIESTPNEGTMVEIHFPIQRVLADR